MPAQPGGVTGDDHSLSTTGSPGSTPVNQSSAAAHASAA